MPMIMHDTRSTETALTGIWQVSRAWSATSPLTDYPVLQSMIIICEESTCLNCASHLPLAVFQVYNRSTLSDGALRLAQ